MRVRRFPAALGAHLNGRFAGIYAALFAILAALVFMALLPTSAGGNDSADFTDFYLPVAHSLLDGEGLRLAGQVADRYPPGFPAALAAAIAAGRLWGLPDELAIRLLGLCGFAATAFTLFRLGRLCHGPAAGLVAAAAFTLYPPHIFLTKLPNSELVFLPLLLLAVELLWRSRDREKGWRYACGAGALLGLAALVRPIALLLFVPLGLFLFFHADSRLSRLRRLSLALLLATGQLLVMAPWLLHLKNERGRFVPLSTGGRLSMLDGLTIAAKKNREAPPMPARVAELMREIEGSRAVLRSPGAIFGFLAGKAREEPATVALLLWVKVSRAFYATDSLRYEGFLLAIQLPFLLLAAAAITFAWRRRTEPWRPLAALALLVLLYFLAMTVLVLSILRYLVPALSLVFLLLGATAAELWRRANAGACDVGTGLGT